MLKNKMDVKILYICRRGQTSIPICVDLENMKQCEKEGKCNLRPVVSLKDYEKLHKKFQKLKELK